MLVPTLMTKVVPPPYIVPSWSTGTDAEIVEAIQKHYAGDIDLTDYWSVGDERTVHLSAMNGIMGSESHSAQDVVLVLSMQGGKTLSDGQTECLFQVDQKDCLSVKGAVLTYADEDANKNSWKLCSRRTWCNDVYYNAIPETLKPIFKLFTNQSSVGNGTSTGVEDTKDYFALRSAIEIKGTNASGEVDGEGSLVTYYETSSNRAKKRNGSVTDYWTRSAHKSYAKQFIYLNDTAIGSSDSSTNEKSLAVFGCI